MSEKQRVDDLIEASEDWIVITTLENPNRLLLYQGSMDRLVEKMETFIRGYHANKNTRVW